MTTNSANALLEHLPEAERKLVEALIKKMQADQKLLDNVCTFLNSLSIGGHMADLKKVSEEIRLQACVDCLVIGLLSGDIKKNKVTSLMENL